MDEKSVWDAFKEGVEKALDVMEDIFVEHEDPVDAVISGAQEIESSLSEGKEEDEE